jgi:hypothetical protein
MGSFESEARFTLGVKANVQLKIKPFLLVQKLKLAPRALH